MRPVDGVTLHEAAHICGCAVNTVRRIEAGRLPAGPRHERRRVSRADAEALALRLTSSLLAFDPSSSHWVTAKGAAAILGVGVTRLNQLVAAGYVPFERHVDGTQLYRRRQLEVVANAREARWCVPSATVPGGLCRSVDRAGSRRHESTRRVPCGGLPATRAWFPAARWPA